MKSLLTSVLASAVLATATVAPAASETYKLAVNLPLSGGWASFGDGMHNSFKLAIDQANASGILGGDTLEVVRGDHAGDTAQAVGLATKAGTDPAVVGAFCCWASGIGLATHAIYNRYGIPTIIGGSNDHRSSRPYHNSKVIFRNSPYDLINMKIAANYVTQIGKFKRVFLIDDNTPFAVTQCTEFAKVAKADAGDGIIVGRESIVAGEKDFNSLLTKIKALNPDLLYFGGRIVEASLIRQQMVKLGMTMPIMSSGGVFSDTYTTITGEPANGSLASFWGLPLEYYPDGRGVKFGKDYEAAKFNQPYESFGPMAYAAGEVFVQAIVAAKKNGKVTRETVLKEMETGQFKTVLGDFKFDQNGMLDILNIAIYQVEKGKWQIKYRTDRQATKLEPVK